MKDYWKRTREVRRSESLMYIILKCPRCGYRWWLEAAAADRRLRCRKCFLLLKVPHLSELADAAGIIDEARSEIYVDDVGRTYG